MTFTPRRQKFDGFLVLPSATCSYEFVFSRRLQRLGGESLQHSFLSVARCAQR
jgi:hypothetical protein